MAFASLSTWLHDVANVQGQEPSALSVEWCKKTQAGVRQLTDPVEAGDDIVDTWSKKAFIDVARSPMMQPGSGCMQVVAKVLNKHGDIVLGPFDTAFSKWFSL